MLYILGIMAGFGIGCWLPANDKFITIIGIITATVIPFSSIFGALFLSGYLVSSYLQLTFIKEFTEAESIEQEAHAVNNVSRFGGALATGTLLFALSGTSMYVNVILLSFSIWLAGMDFLTGGVLVGMKKAAPYILGVVAIFVAALLTVTNIDKLAIFAFFLTLRNLPDMLADSMNIKYLRENDHDSFCVAYGVSGHGPVYNGLVLAQTIMWSSQKDTLGTIINAALGSSVDQFRIYWALTLIACICLFKWQLHRFQSRVDAEYVKLEAKSHVKERTNHIMFGLCIYFCCITIGLALTCTLLTIGVFVSVCMPRDLIKRFGIPALLIMGAVS